MLFKRVSKGRNCPQCKSADVFRLRRTGMALKLIGNVTNLRPYWCANRRGKRADAVRRGRNAWPISGWQILKAYTL